MSLTTVQPAMLTGTGKVVQVVQGTLSGSTSTTSTSFVSTGLSATITPLFSTSKILVMSTISGIGGTSNPVVFFTVYRGSTNIAPSGSGRAQNFIDLAPSTQVQMGSLMYLDSPATTSSTTYTIYYAVNLGSTTFNGDGQTSTIILMEVAA